MSFSIKAAACIIAFLFFWLSMEQNFQWDLKHQLLKQSNNLAVHDAILLPLKEPLSEGRIIFDPSEAREVFEETLRLNMGLDEQLKPFEGSPLTAPVKVVEFIILDDSNSTFPFLYENETYKVTKYLHGPAAFAVIKTDFPKLINAFGTGSDIQIPAIQEYKADRLYP